MFVFRQKESVTPEVITLKKIIDYSYFSFSSLFSKVYIDVDGHI